MACTAVTTGQGFLSETLAHLDCQAQSIGSFGYGALAGGASPAGAVLTALLTLFIALLGLRLLFAGQVGMQDAVGAALKIGIVLTLAASWPAYRIIAYDTVIHGPSEVAATLGNENLPAMEAGLAERLQGIDDGIVALTTVGTGRQVGSLDVPGERPGSFTGVAMVDESGFGWGRTVFLGATIGPLAALRIAGGLLLAIAPLVAGLLLFDLTRGIFAGWLRGLVLVALGSVGITLLLAAQVAIMEPWIADALNRRALGYATPGVATELVALALGFGIASFVLLAILAKVAFQNSWPVAGWLRGATAPGANEERVPVVAGSSRGDIPVQSRALAVSDGMLATMRREESSGRQNDRGIGDSIMRASGAGGSSGSGIASGSAAAMTGGRTEPLGTSYRRNNAARRGGSHRRRDDRK